MNYLLLVRGKLFGCDSHVTLVQHASRFLFSLEPPPTPDAEASFSPGFHLAHFNGRNSIRVTKKTHITWEPSWRLVVKIYQIENRGVDQNTLVSRCVAANSQMTQR